MIKLTIINEETGKEIYNGVANGVEALVFMDDSSLHIGQGLYSNVDVLNGIVSMVRNRVKYTSSLREATAMLDALVKAIVDDTLDTILEDIDVADIIDIVDLIHERYEK